MNDILKKYGDIDYRIMDIESCRESYDKFLKELKEKRSLGKGNEYEIEGEGLDEISNKYGFYPRTAIVLFVPFMTEEKARVSEGANLSSHAFSRDYHMIVKKIMNEIVDDSRMAVIGSVNNRRPAKEVDFRTGVDQTFRIIGTPQIGGDTERRFSIAIADIKTRLFLHQKVK